MNKLNKNNDISFHKVLLMNFLSNLINNCIIYLIVFYLNLVDIININLIHHKHNNIIDSNMTLNNLNLYPQNIHFYINIVYQQDIYLFKSHKINNLTQNFHHMLNKLNDILTYITY